MEKNKNLQMFILEILGFVDMIALDGRCMGFPSGDPYR